MHTNEQREKRKAKGHKQAWNREERKQLNEDERKQTQAQASNESTQLIIKGKRRMKMEVSMPNAAHTINKQRNEGEEKREKQREEKESEIDVNVSK